jgi:hypothetical protein
MMLKKRNANALLITLASFAILALLGIFRGAQVGKADTTLMNPSIPNWISSSSTFTTYLPLALRNYPPPPPVFGVEVGQLTTSFGFDRVNDLGAYWVRYHAFSWDKIEANQGEYDWGSVDEAGLQQAYERGLRIIATIKFAPQWAQKYPGSYCGPIKVDALDDFARFLTALVQRYKAPPYGIKYWELGNEPDLPLGYNRNDFGCWGEARDTYYGGGYYAEMLKRAYPAIKAADPEAIVFIGGLAIVCDPDDPPPGQDCKHSRFLEGILSNGGGPYFDVVSFHAYAWYGGDLGQMYNRFWTGGEIVQTTALAERVNFLRGVLQKYGYGEKSLFDTETALTCEDDTSDCRETQAMYATKAYAEAIAFDLTGRTWFAMTNDGWYYTGLLQGSDLAAKPSFYAYQTASDFLGNARYVGPVEYAGVEGYKFKDADATRFIEVVWASDGSYHTIVLPPGASAYDRYGNLVASSGSVQVGYAPLYIVY